MKTWERVKHNDIPPGPDGKPRRFLMGTWAFKLKCIPGGSPLEYKVCYCVLGYLQPEGVEYFKIYAPIVQWSTISLALTMIISNN